MKNETAAALWSACLEIVRKTTSNDEFEKWFVPTRGIAMQGNVLTIEIPDKSFYDYIEAHYADVLRDALDTTMGRDAHLRYSIARKAAIKAPVQNVAKVEKVRFSPQLNASYTFSQLVEGASNHAALSAARTIALSPGKTAFNPIFIYGGVGLGKTHLVQAIGNDIVTRFPDAKVLYVPSEKFIQQYVDAYAQDRRNDFINFYQNIDTLIIDDVQFFSGKKGSQEVFFHIFNHLHQNNKQLVMTADRTPVDMRDITDRLLSRFKWGLTVKLDTPDFEHRLRILEDKLRREDINDIPHDVVVYIAKTVNTNVRELEGVVNSLLMHSTIVRREITLELAIEVVSQFIKMNRRELTLDYIKTVVCEMMGVEPALLESASRRGEIVRARQVAMYFAKTLTQNYSLQQIGSYIAGRDHSTVIHSCKTVSNLLETDKKFKMRVDEIRLKLLSA
ncbi:MAG: chromosomal replication initiator protein DnaA [Flavobacteriales bacterium]|jgi:chromosomal replication initiator protein|nr:chromosomal replication initiator protein DnaA [Flavobacteriales bacterium]MBQ1968118.1 chromosomal replication initiator protein DnaA [Flavobacteriales bacterium]